MKKVCVFHFPRIENFHGYSIDSLDPVPYFREGASRLGAAKVFSLLYEAKWIDEMYRDRNPSYMRFVYDFVDKFKDADLVVFFNGNPVHPDVLYRDLERPIKILGFADEPLSTYVRGIPYLWAFDGAFYITPSFNETTLFPDALGRWGCSQTYWLANVPPRLDWLPQASVKGKASERGHLWPLTEARAVALRRGDGFFKERDIDSIYVGCQYGPKVDRLIRLKERFGSRFRIHGKWPLAGYGGIARVIKGRRPLWTRVRPISAGERASLYYRTKIGINMHLSMVPRETGNMRMYEVPAHGMMLLCDKAGMNAHAQIFEPDKEAVFYDSIEDAIERIEYYLEHEAERIRIAQAGFARVHRDYDGELNLKNFLDWATCIPQRKMSVESAAQLA
ncbi:MAG TPA: glycosyltransferase [Terriglobales bacterium]|nr:glycosyltransferase [Terriglobales bacterium]